MSPSHLVWRLHVIQWSSERDLILGLENLELLPRAPLRERWAGLCLCMSRSLLCWALSQDRVDGWAASGPQSLLGLCWMVNVYRLLPAAHPNGVRMFS